MASEALISLVVDRLVTYAQEKLTLVRSARDEARKLAGTLIFIQKVLADAEQKQVTNEVLKVWLAKLKDVAYDAEDVLDEWNTKAAFSRLQTGDVDANIASGSTNKKVFSFLLPPCLCFKDVSARYNVGQHIKEIRERLDEIAKEREQYALVASDSRKEFLSTTPQTTSSVNVSEIYGRDGDKRIIMNMILRDSSSQGRMPVHVISIVGTGGFGKTTLAKLIFNEKKVENAFDFRIWVCVSQPFNLSKIAEEIVEQIAKATNKAVLQFHGPQALLGQLTDLVKGKRFLLTLDDVWTKDHQEWEPLKLSLNEGASGSHIIVTTRSREVAMMIESTHILDLGVLSEEDSWSLLMHVALRGKEQKLKKFEKIGKKIASNCKGVPLALKNVASLLYQKQSIQDWRDVANNSLWEMPKIKEFFLPSLFISYYSLSPVSKRCFSFCALFPKDTIIRKSTLVELWVANGFFGYEGNEELEKTGETEFDILAMHSFFQDFERDSDEVITECKMHDLVHDFAQFLSQGECFADEGNDVELDVSKLRHLWTECYNDKFYKAKNLRTLFDSRANAKEGMIRLASNIVSHIDKLACLRTLYLKSCDITELPISVCRLLHLRCLNLRNCWSLSELPEEICNLYNLQTLDLRDCVILRKLPERIGDLSNLRHLKIKDTDELKCLPQGIKRLTFLRTLDKVIVSERNTEFKIGDLSHLHKLQGRLAIHGLGRMKDANEVAHPELNKKNAIGHLELYFDAPGAEETSELDMVTTNSVLERLEPPEHLETLRIDGYLGDRFPGWMHNSLLLSNVVLMRLYGCVNCTQLPPLGNLESLETLEIRDCELLEKLNLGGDEGVSSEPLPLNNQSVQVARPSSRTMPNLRSLRLENLPNWKGEERGECPSLIKVDIISCEKLKVVPHYVFSPTLQELYIQSCPRLEKLNFGGGEGVFSQPLPHNNQSIQVTHPSHLSLIQLILWSCASLDLDLKDLQQFINLRYLHIWECPHLANRFQGEEWRSILSHVAHIVPYDMILKSATE